MGTGWVATFLVAVGAWDVRDGLYFCFSVVVAKRRMLLRLGTCLSRAEVGRSRRREYGFCPGCWVGFVS